MTICAAVKARDGLVLGTDSMTQIQAANPDGTVGVIQTYGNARKLFQVKDLPIGVMSYGAGNVGNRSIQGLMSDFQQGIGAGVTVVPEIVQALFEFFSAAHDTEFGDLEPEQRPALGFFVAGYSEGGDFAEEWEFLLPYDTTPQTVRPADTFGSSWRGVDIPFTRLIMGFDPRVREGLANIGLDDGTVQAVMDVMDQFGTPTVYDGMPVQDAINYATYILRTTIGFDNFEIGPPGCGGPVQVAIVLPNTGFRWVQRPEFYVETN